MFENNVTFNTNEDFRSQFNSDWAGKLLIVVDEVLLNRREDSERLKNLSTTFTYKVEAKGKDRTEIAFCQIRVMFQQRVPAHTHRRRRNTLLGTEDNAVAER